MTAANRVSISVFREFVDEFARADTAAVLVYAGQIFFRTDPTGHEQSVVPFGANGSSDSRLSGTLPASLGSLASDLRSALGRNSLQPGFSSFTSQRDRMRVFSALLAACHTVSILPHGERYGKASVTFTRRPKMPMLNAKRIA